MFIDVCLFMWMYFERVYYLFFRLVCDDADDDNKVSSGKTDAVSAFFNSDDLLYVAPQRC